MSDKLLIYGGDFVIDIKTQQFDLAAERLGSILHHTVLDLSATFSRMTEGEVYLKCENRQKTGSFKIRGAVNKIASLVETGNVKSVVASSAGNHAQGVAYAASKFNIPATIVMPKTAPLAKVNATEGYGAKVVLAGNVYDDAYAEACRISEEEGATFVHPYDDLDVISGQGTLGLEILSDLPNVDIVIVPVGGGGLLAGISAAIKQINPRVKVYGVQAIGADAFAQSFRAGTLIYTDTASTIADGIQVKTPGKHAFELAKKYADGVVTVTDAQIAEAILLLMERSKMIVEAAGAAPLAAVLHGSIDIKGQKAVCVMSGGNIDVSFVQNLIVRGLFARHRRIKFSVILEDRPDSLSRLADVIASSGANILGIEHDKFIFGLNPNEISVHIVCEVSGEDHEKSLYEAIRNHHFAIQENLQW